MNNVDKFYWITFLNSCSFLAPVTTLFYIHRGLSLSQIFLLLLIIVCSMFLFEIPTGIFGDKYGRKNSILIGLFLNFLLAIYLIFANSFLKFAILMFFVGICITFISGSDEALIYDSLKAENKQSQMKKVMYRINSASFIPKVFTAIAGAFIAKDLLEGQFLTILYIGVVINFSAFILGIGLKEPKMKKNASDNNSIKLFLSSFRDIKNNPVILRLILNKTFVIIICSHLFDTLWQPYLQESKVPIYIFGILVAASSAIIALANSKVEVIEKKISDEKLLFFTSLLPAIAFLLAIIFRNIIFAIVLYFVIRLLFWIRNPVFSHYINHHISSKNRATLLSCISVIDSFFDIIIFLSASYAVSLGINYLLLFSGLVLLLTTAFFGVKTHHLSLKKIRN